LAQQWLYPRPFSRVSQAAEAHQLRYTSEVIIGEPDECLINTSKKADFDLVIMGSPRPKGKSGLRSRMVTKATQALPLPVMMVPYPDE
jgi:nucleotide-binding universal stress UspA family protein